MEIALGLNREGVQKMNILKKHYNTNSNAAILERALALLAFAVELNEKNGRLVGLQGQDTISIEV